MTIPAYPLQWPAGWKRTPSYRRDSGRFGKRRAAAGGYTGKGELTVADAVARVREQLRMMRVRDDDLVVEAAYRRLRSLHHPDRGGDAAAFHRVQEAYEQWRSEARHA